MTADSTEYARFFRADDLAPLECLSARFSRHVFVPHFHEQYVVNSLTTGAQSYRYLGGRRVAGAGSLVFINPGEIHTGESAHASGWSYCGFYPSTRFILDLAQQLCGRPVTPYCRETSVADADLAMRLERLQGVLRLSHDALQRESALIAVFSDVLLRHMELREKIRAAPDPGVLQRVRQLLGDRLAENLSLQELAHEAQLSPWHLNRSFRARFGLPPVAWRNQQRLIRARGLLAAGMPVATVAAALGFADQPHLTRAFRAVTGVTPAAYRRAMAPRQPLAGASTLSTRQY